MSGDVTIHAHEPQCPKCGKAHLSVRKPFLGEDDANVKCDFCGETSPVAEWFNHPAPEDGVSDMDE